MDDGPPLWNMSCLNYAVWEDLPPPNVSDILKSLSLLLLGLSVMTCNLLWILVLKSKRFRDTSVSDQPRCLLMSLGANAFFTGSIVALFAAPSTFWGCWTFGIQLCKNLAFLNGVLNQHYIILLVGVSLDRFLCLRRGVANYAKNASKQNALLFLVASLAFSASFFSYFVLWNDDYNFLLTSAHGIKSCVPRWPKSSFRIIFRCSFYFFPTVALMYFYGSAFHRKYLLQQQQQQQQQQQTESATSAESSTSSSFLNHGNINDVISKGH